MFLCDSKIKRKEISVMFADKKMCTFVYIRVQTTIEVIVTINVDAIKIVKHE